MNIKMKIRTKIILLIVFITIISNGCISYYILKTFSNDVLKYEYIALKNVVSLTRNIIEDKYYSMLSKQLYRVYDTKDDLKKNATIVRSAVLGKDVQKIENNSNYQNIMLNLVRNLNSIGINFLIYDKNKFKGTNEALNFLQAKDSNQNDLINLVTFPTPYEGRSHILYLNNKKYLAYICLGNSIKDQKLILIKDISSFIDQSDELLYSDIREVKRAIKKISEINGSIVFVTNQNGKVLNSSTKNHDFIKDFIAHNDIYTEESEINCLSNDNFSTCHAFFKPLNLHITVVKQENKMWEFSNEIIKDAYPFVILFLIFGTVISVIIVSKITTSLKDIAEKAQTIAKADLSNPEELKKISQYNFGSNYEINKIYEAFSTMTSSLNQSILEMLATNTAKNRIETELNVAHDIQMGMLPNSENTPHSETLDIASYLQPAKEVGGDFFDVFRVNDDSIAITIGDVSDKGVPAAMFMSICVTTLRQLLKSQNKISTALSALNNALSERNPNMMFVTLFVMVINEKTGKFSYGNAGHCQPCLIAENKSVSELQGLSGPAIGVMEGIQYNEFEGQLDNNEYIYVYTDGVSEAQNSHKKFFEVKNIINTLKNNSFENSQSILDKILKEVIEFRGNAPQSDDITMVSIKYQQPAQDELDLNKILEKNDKPILTEK